MNKKILNKEIDKIHNAIDVLMRNDCWDFIDDILYDFTPRLWRTDIDILLSYATATFPGKSKLPSRKEFMRLCTSLHSDPKLWSGLE